jgi:hypothetical protein
VGLERLGHVSIGLGTLVATIFRDRPYNMGSKAKKKKKLSGKVRFQISATFHIPPRGRRVKDVGTQLYRACAIHVIL